MLEFHLYRTCATRNAKETATYRHPKNAKSPLHKHVNRMELLEKNTLQDRENCSAEKTAIHLKPKANKLPGQWLSSNATAEVTRSF